MLIMGGLDGESNIIPLGTTEAVEADKYTFQGFTLMDWFQTVSYEDKQKLYAEHSKKLKNELATTIAQTFHLKDIGQAIEESRKNQTKGKILVIP